MSDHFLGSHKLFCAKDHLERLWKEVATTSKDTRKVLGGEEGHLSPSYNSLFFIPHPIFVLAIPINPHFQFSAPVQILTTVATCVFMYLYVHDENLRIVIKMVVNNGFSESLDLTIPATF